MDRLADNSSPVSCSPLTPPDSLPSSLPSSADNSIPVSPALRNSPSPNGEPLNKDPAVSARYESDSTKKIRPSKRPTSSTSSSGSTSGRSSGTSSGKRTPPSGTTALLYESNKSIKPGLPTYHLHQPPPLSSAFTLSRDPANVRFAQPAPSPTTAIEHANETLVEEMEVLEEFLHVRSMTAYQYSYWRAGLFYFIAPFTAGIFLLLAHWFPQFFIPFRYRRCSMGEAEYVYVLGVQHGGEMVKVIYRTAETEEEKKQRQMNEEYQYTQNQISPSTGSGSGGHRFNYPPTSTTAVPSTEALPTATEQERRLRQIKAEMEIYKQRKEVQNSLRDFPVSSSTITSALSSPAWTSNKMIVWRHCRFMYNSDHQLFERVQYMSRSSSRELQLRLQCGLTEEQAETRSINFGLNVLTIIVPTYMTLLLGEAFHPFYVFQLYSVILWCFEEYYIFALCILVIAVISIANTLIETRRRLIGLSTLAYFTTFVPTLRSSVFSLTSSAELVVGDIVEVLAGTVPCDIALLDGGCVVNESMLTGESIPVVKSNIQWPPNKNSETWIKLGVDQRSTLFCATKVLQLKPSTPGGKVLGIVVRTGFATTKGSLILSILYPKPSSFKFVEQSYKFIGVLFAVALIGFGLTIWQLRRVDAADLTIIIRGLDLITIVVPPSLPLALSVGTNFALSALKKMQIFCISPSRINMAGKVRLMAFDKTGTLTADVTHKLTTHMTHHFHLMTLVIHLSVLFCVCCCFFMCLWQGLEFVGVLSCVDGAFSQYQTEIADEGGTVVTSTTHASAVHLSTEKHTSDASNGMKQIIEVDEDRTDSQLDLDVEEYDDDDDDDEEAEEYEDIDQLNKQTRNGSSDDVNNTSATVAASPAASGPDSAAYTYDPHHPHPISTPLLYAMSSCHSLAVLDNALIGDPLDLQIFQVTRARLQDFGHLRGFKAIIHLFSGSRKVCLGIKEQFEFVSTLQRMSVVTETIGDATAAPMCYVKGSPEAISALCVRSSLPHNFVEVLREYTHQGYRVIALACKSLPDGLPAEMEKDEQRKLLESELTFMGLILLENAVKPETAPTLQTLKKAKIRCVMVTGDNPLTAVAVAKECGMVDPGTVIYQSQLIKTTKGDELYWADTDNHQNTLDPVSLTPSPLSVSPHPDRWELAVTGPAFAHLLSLRNASHPSSHFHRVLLATQIFARMLPDQKATLMGHLQSLGLYCGFCGDGANDCGALKTGHIGVSLSDSEASIAAPFTYQRPNISCIPDLLREGRSSLATSFQLFKFIALYSMIQFGAAILTYFVGSVLGNWQYLWADMGIVFPITILMGDTAAQKILSVKRPSAQLTSLSNLVNLGGHTALCLGVQVFVFLETRNAPGYVLPYNPNNTPNAWETTSLYYCSNFQYIIMAALFAFGALNFKANPLTNLRLTGWWCFVLILSLLLVLVNSLWGFWRSDDIDLPAVWRYKIALLFLINAALNTLYEFVVFPLLVRATKRVRRACSYGIVGSWYGRRKRISGSGSAVYHVLRGEFESYWYGGRGDLRVLGKKQKHKGKKAAAAVTGSKPSKSSGLVPRRQKKFVS